MSDTIRSETLKKYIIGMIITILATSVCAATGWNFKKTSEIAERYLSKDDFSNFVFYNNEEHCEIKKKLDKIYDQLLKLYQGTNTNYTVEDAVIEDETDRRRRMR